MKRRDERLGSGLARFPLWKAKGKYVKETGKMEVIANLQLLLAIGIKTWVFQNRKLPVESHRHEGESTYRRSSSLGLLQRHRS
jgi:hypothetical protein